MELKKGTGLCIGYLWTFLCVLGLPYGQLALTTTQSPKESPYICKSNGNDFPAESLKEAFSVTASGDDDVKTDLIFILDTSVSVATQPAWGNSKTLLRELMTYLQMSRRVKLHWSQTRVAVLSFGKESVREFDGISQEKSAVTSCDFDARLEGIQASEKQDESNLASALSQAKDIYDTHEGNTKILWLFWDGNSGENLTYSDKLPSDWAKQLKKENVVVFAAAIGENQTGWLNSVDHEINVKKLAFDANHYACSLTWIALVRNLTAELTTNEREAELFVRADSKRCSVCRVGSQCGCDVNNGEFGCFSNDVFSRNRVDAGWILWVVVGVAVLIFLIFIIVTTALCCRKNKRRQEEEKYYTENIYGGPPLPPPPVRRRPHRDITPVGPEAIYGNMDRFNPTDGYDDVEVSVHAYTDVIMPYQFCLQNTDVSELEQDMSGWPEHLLETRATFQLLHIGVRSFGSPSFAVTPGFSLSVKETRELEKALRLGTAYKPDSVKIGGEMHLIDRAETSELLLRATYNKPLKNQNRKRKRKEKTESMYAVIGTVRQFPEGDSEGQGRLDTVAWVAVVCDYVVVGVAAKERDSVCQEAVMEIRRYLETLIQEHAEPGTFDLEPPELPPAPHRRY